MGLLAAVVLFGTLSLERETARSAVAADPAVAVSSSEAAFVEDYLRRAVGEDFLETSDPEEIARFLRRELGLHSGPLRLAGLVPTRVEICLLDGKRGAMVVYRWDGRQVTHYLVPNESEPHEPSLAPHHAGLTVVTWSSGKIEEAIVAEADPETLLDLLRTPGD